MMATMKPLVQYVHSTVAFLHEDYKLTHAKYRHYFLLVVYLGTG